MSGEAPSPDSLHACSPSCWDRRFSNWRTRMARRVFRSSALARSACKEARLTAASRPSSDLVRAAAGVHQQLDRGAGMRVAGTQDVEAVTELAHHLRREVAAGASVLGVVGDVLGLERELLGQSVQGLMGLRQPEASHAEDHAPQVAEIDDVARGGDFSLSHLVAHPVEEGHDVVAAQEPRVSGQPLRLPSPAQPRSEHPRAHPGHMSLGNGVDP